MVVVEIKARDQRLTISRGRIVDGDMQHAPLVKVLANTIKSHSEDGDQDYLIALELVSMHGGRIVMDD